MSENKKVQEVYFKLFEDIHRAVESALWMLRHDADQLQKDIAFRNLGSLAAAMKLKQTNLRIAFQVCNKGKKVLTRGVVIFKKDNRRRVYPSGIADDGDWPLGDN